MARVLSRDNATCDRAVLDFLVPQSRQSNIVQAVVALGTAGLVYWDGRSFVFAWTLSIMTVVAVALAHIRFADRSNDSRFLVGFRLARLAVSLVWGAGFFHFMSSSSPETGSLLGLIAIGLVSGASQSLYLDRISLLCFAGPLLAGVVIAYAVQGSAAGWIGAVLLLVFFGFVNANARDRREQHQRVHEANKTLYEQKQILEQMNEQLEGARAAAMAASRAKGDFLANMSHEIRTPMNGIVGMADLLSRSNLDEDQIESVAAIQSSADCLLTIINDVLDFSKIEAGELQLERISFDLQETVQEVVALLAPQTAAKPVALKLRYSPNVPRRFKGDPIRIRQILLNLVGNALKFTAEGHILVSVNLVEEREGLANLHLSIEDTGIGVPEERRTRLFQRFSQIDSSTTRRFGGTGLGLAISQRLVEAMDGQIGMHAREGGGSVFFFTLAMEVDQNHDSAENHKALEGKRVLVCSPEELDRLLLTERMISWGMQTQLAYSPAEVLEIIESSERDSRPVDLLIIGSALARQAARALGESLRSRKGASLRMVRILSQQDSDEHERCSESFYDACFVDPTRPDHLARGLAMLLSGETAPRKAPVPAAWREAEPQFDQKVLVVDDNRLNRVVARRMLERLGCKVQEAGNGQEALDALEEHPVNLVFMDCQMPVMDGFEATGRILADPERYARPLIAAMTANAMAGDREQCLAAGMHEFLSKPIKLDQITRLLEKMLSPA